MHLGFGRRAPGVYQAPREHLLLPLSQLPMDVLVEGCSDRRRVTMQAWRVQYFSHPTERWTQRDTGITEFLSRLRHKNLGCSFVCGEFVGTAV